MAKYNSGETQTISLEAASSGDLQSRLDRLSEQTGLSNFDLVQKWILQEEFLLGTMARSAVTEPAAPAKAKRKTARKAAAEPEGEAQDSAQTSNQRTQLVKRVKKLRKSGVTLKKIVDTFNEENVPTVSGTGKWHTSSVVWLLKSHAKSK